MTPPDTGEDLRCARRHTSDLGHSGGQSPAREDHGTVRTAEWSSQI